jgi:hypothetical protein
MVIRLNYSKEVVRKRKVVLKKGVGTIPAVGVLAIGLALVGGDVFFYQLLD